MKVELAGSEKMEIEVVEGEVLDLASKTRSRSWAVWKNGCAIRATLK